MTAQIKPHSMRTYGFEAFPLLGMTLTGGLLEPGVLTQRQTVKANTETHGFIGFTC